jgi:YD repeat-containing protein
LTVQDPRSKTTTYTYNNIGDMTRLASPDTGTTTMTFDSGGNLATQTDARNKTGTYSYDALNRVTSIAYPDRTTSFTYDAGTNGAGRLTGAADATHSLSWSYLCSCQLGSPQLRNLSSEPNVRSADFSA